jgi:hypothetical protein
MTASSEVSLEVAPEDSPPESSAYRGSELFRGICVDSYGGNDDYAYFAAAFYLLGCKGADQSEDR